MRRWLRPVCLALLLGTAGTIGPARAQDAAELQAARDKFQKALALQTGGDWASALALLKEVAAVRSTPQVRFNIALCEENLGQLVAAVGDYELAAADARSADESEVVEQAGRRLSELIGRIPKVVVERGANADTATITLDGVALGDQVIGKSMNVDPGPHVITARAVGFDSFRTTVRVDEAETKTIVVSLTPIAEPKPAPLPAPDGVALEPSPPIAAYVAGGIGVASLVTAGIMYGLAQGANRELERACNGLSCPPDMEDTGKRGETYTTLANVGLGVGIVGIGLGTVFYVTHERDNASGFRPGAPDSLAGCSYVGRF
ncbi:MAG TPA: hypothetical protein VFU02_02495 [Polyangiaceae bacterium]|nr:hypothetical protein [Polyangiaceae bacterium]